MPGKLFLDLFTVFTISNIFLLLDVVLSHRCYICGTDINGPSCDNFNPNNSIFTKECLPSSQGCSIQKHGSIIIRACEDYKLDDCQIANNVEYCYCSNNLCNNKEPFMFNLGISDDEDIVEGSGLKSVTIKTTTKETVHFNQLSTPPSISTGNTPESKYFLIVALFMLNN